MLSRWRQEVRHEAQHAQFAGWPVALPFTERLLPFGDATAWEPFRKLSRAGKVPALLDGDHVVWDSLAIVEYLAERHPGVWPADPLTRAWARSAAAEMHAGFQTLRNICTMNCGLRITLRDFPDALKHELRGLDSLWNEGLTQSQGPYLAGTTFTAVDAFFAPVAFRIQTYGLTLSDASLQYAERLRALPAMKHWYDAALKETWREPHHEEDARRAGQWREDLRAR